LADLADDEHQLLIRNPTDIDLDVQHIVRREFSGDSPGHDIQILEALDDARNRAGISVSDDLQPSPRVNLGRIHETNTSFLWLEEQTREYPGLRRRPGR
jgi:hypothetical protein